MLRIACALICCAALLACGEEDEPAPRPAATPTATANAGDTEVRDVAQRFLEARWAGDLKTQCKLEGEGSFTCELARTGKATPVKGKLPEITEIRVQEDIAFAEADGGVSLTLLKEKGKWLVDDARGMPESVVTRR